MKELREKNNSRVKGLYTLQALDEASSILCMRIVKKKKKTKKH